MYKLVNGVGLKLTLCTNTSTIFVVLSSTENPYARVAWGHLSENVTSSKRVSKQQLHRS